MSRSINSSIEQEYHRYHDLVKKAMEQVSEELLAKQLTQESNSLVVLVQHLSGNFRSRFTDFLTSDGEKPWRNRDQEFLERKITRSEVNRIWTEGWSVLFQALSGLTDESIAESVVIRGQSLVVHEALHRSLAHAAYHVGQMLFLAKVLSGGEWVYQSIPPGGSNEYNRKPTLEKGLKRP